MFGLPIRCYGVVRLHTVARPGAARWINRPSQLPCTSSRNFQTSTNCLKSRPLQEPVRNPRRPKTASNGTPEPSIDIEEVYKEPAALSIFQWKYQRRENPELLRPFFFTLAIGIGAFTTATYLTRTAKARLTQLTNKPNPTAQDLFITRVRAEVSKARQSLRHFQNGFSILAPYYKNLLQRWLTLNDGERMGIAIAAANLAVFAVWRIPAPAVQSFMQSHFLHYPLSRKSYTMLTSTFSQSGLLHFGFNMFALQGFISSIYPYMASTQAHNGGRAANGHYEIAEPKSSWQILAFYLTAGVVASFGSQVHAALKIAGAARTGSSSVLKAAQSAIRPELGASGALYGVVVLSALTQPDSNIGLILVPGLQFPIGYGVLGLVSMDMIGLLRGWQTFGHAAHLSGAVFGAAYFYGGPFLWMRKDMS